jgi:hypothetical protein
MCTIKCYLSVKPFWQLICRWLPALICIFHVRKTFITWQTGIRDIFPSLIFVIFWSIRSSGRLLSSGLTLTDKSFRRLSVCGEGVGGYITTECWESDDFAGRTGHGIWHTEGAAYVITEKELIKLKYVMILRAFRWPVQIKLMMNTVVRLG